MARHLIFTSGRSGSNYLANTPNNSPECLNFGEILVEWTLPYRLIGKYIIKFFGTARYIDLVYGSTLFFYLAQGYSAFAHLNAGRQTNFKSKRFIKSVRFKDFLVTMERHDGLRYVRANQDIKIIYLKRNNLLKRYISSLHMGRTKMSASFETVAPRPIFVDIEWMMKALRIMKNEVDREEKFLESLIWHNTMRIEYEEYFASEETIAQHSSRLFEFLEVTPAPGASRQKKILPDHLCDVVVNHTEVVKALKGTPFEKYVY